MPILDATDLRKQVGDRILLDGVSLTIRRGEKVGFVGHNGSGKSSLGRILAGIDEADEGKIARRRDSTCAYLEQEPQFEPGRSVRDIVLESLAEWNEAKRHYDALTEALGSESDPDEQTRLALEQADAAQVLERQGGWDRVHEAEATLGHLGIFDADRLVDTLSGGEARRVALARLLVAQPDFAILDEPTNHLDLDTIEWLEEKLATDFEGAVLLISHDRRVLDRVTTRTLEIHEGIVRSYDGGYAAYLIGKAEREAHADRTERNRQNFLRREVEWLRRAPKARGTKQKARIGRAEAALDMQAPREEKVVELRLASERQGKTILGMKGVSIEREGQPLIAGLDLALSPGERIGIVGPNGSGKTSLLLTLLGEIPAAGGEIVIGANTKIGYLDQARAGLDPNQTVREAALGDATEVKIGEERLKVGSYLERFLFDRRQQRLRVSELSGGERARVCLARLLARRCNLLLLDEPTNDLDVATLGALESMLLDFGGSVLLVSHDRWLLDRLATSIMALDGEGGVEMVPGNFSDYRARHARRSNLVASATSSTRSGATDSVISTEEAPDAVAGKTSAPLAKLTYAERIELDGLLEKIEEAEAVVAAVQARLSDPETYQDAGVDVAALNDELARAEGVAESLTGRWEDLESRASGAGGD